MKSSNFAYFTVSINSSLSDSQPTEKEVALVNYLVNSSPLALDLTLFFLLFLSKEGKCSFTF